MIPASINHNLPLELNKIYTSIYKIIVFSEG